MSQSLYFSRSSRRHLHATSERVDTARGLCRWLFKRMRPERGHGTKSFAQAKRASQAPSSVTSSCFETRFPERRIEFESVAEVAPGLVRAVASAFRESGDIKVIGVGVFPSVFLRRAARKVVQNLLAFARPAELVQGKGRVNLRLSARVPAERPGRLSLSDSLFPRLTRAVTLTLGFERLAQPVKRRLVMGLVRLADAEIRRILEGPAKRRLRFLRPARPQLALPLLEIGPDVNA